jgi:Antimicrobial peptide resistance and lipid A acylation protein PagP
MAHLTFRPFPHLLAGCLAAIAAAGSAAAEELTPPASWYDRVVQRLETTWQEGQPELYLPLYTYHLPYAYTRQKINSYDITPLGLGVGKGVYDQAGDWHGLYVMGFHDSHFKPGYIAGYGYKTFWHLSEELKFGLGYTTFLTTRADIGHYTPIPGVLPMVSLEYQKFSLDSAYVPGGQGFGNILFFWGKMRF